MPKKVLIVDADTESWQSIGAFLGDKGYEVGYSSEFNDALEKAQKQNYNLIIFDMCWPTLDGMSGLAKFSEIIPEAKVIAVSEFADRELEQEAICNGACVCLIRPVNEDELLQAINSPGFAKCKTEAGLSTGKNIEQTLLRGFTPDQQWDFRMIGSSSNYQRGDVIPMNDESRIMIWVERGRLLVYHNDIPVESLGEGDFWGEEAFVNPGSIITHLVAQDDVQIRYFSRKRLMEFFAYYDETLIKRFMINLINCLQIKWHKTISRLVQNVLPPTCKVDEEANVVEL